MKRMFSLIFLVLIVFSTSASALPHYCLTELAPPSISSKKESHAYAINDLGQIVGSSSDWMGAALMWENGKVRSLSGRVDHLINYDQARDINQNGVAVGVFLKYYGVPEQRRAARWDSNGLLEELSSLGGSNSIAFKVNSVGQIIGGSDLPGGGSHYVLWSGDEVIDLTVEGLNMASGINDRGQIAGTYNPNSGGTFMGYSACIWQDGKFIDLAGRNPWVSGINNLGDVIGTVSDTGGRIWLDDNGYQAVDLGEWVVPLSINDKREVVGYYLKPDRGKTPFLWKGGIFYDLSNQIINNGDFLMWEARDINNNGQIVGFGWHNGYERAFLLDPVPEPSSVVVLATGLVGIFGSFRRRMNR